MNEIQDDELKRLKNVVFLCEELLDVRDKMGLGESERMTKYIYSRYGIEIPKLPEIMP